MTEINDIKRTYSQNFKYNWDQRASKEAVRSRNLQDNLRKAQFDKAREF